MILTRELGSFTWTNAGILLYQGGREIQRLPRKPLLCISLFSQHGHVADYKNIGYVLYEEEKKQQQQQPNNPKQEK